LLKKPQNLTDQQATTLKRLKAAGGEVWRAHTLKEALTAIFAPGLTVEDVTVLIDRFIRLGINQGRTEALNNKVRLITRRACGFHSAKAALALVLLTRGPITLQPPHEPQT
jgi:transposase